MKKKTRSRPDGDRSCHHSSFPPVADANARVLILGSLPGRRSLELQQYYAHPRNLFWKIIGAVVGEEFPADYAQRIKLLQRHRIAVWDVFAAAERPGSLDSAIVDSSSETNDFKSFFAAHPGITRVFFNGQKAASAYRRAVPRSLGEELAALSYLTLPSTSPAHAALAYSRKLAAWTAIRSGEQS